jgi:hypothetical protein
MLLSCDGQEKRVEAFQAVLYVRIESGFVGGRPPGLPLRIWGLPNFYRQMATRTYITGSFPT